MINRDFFFAHSVHVIHGAMKIRSSDVQKNPLSLSGLWKVLSENNFSHRVLISVLHSFIESCDKVKDHVHCIVFPVSHSSF